MRTLRLSLRLAAFAAALALPLTGQESDPIPDAEPPPVFEEPEAAAGCERHVYANVVALDQVFYLNRLGAFEPQGQVYALEHDVVHPSYNQNTCTGPAPSAGNAVLRRDKRPRPLVLRMNVGDCLHIQFKNWLATSPRDEEQPHTRSASIHVVGMQYGTSIADGGTNVGLNPAGGVVSPGGTVNYTLYGQAPGTFLLYNGAVMVSAGGEGGTISTGLFGAVNVEPRGAEWYRSQVTAHDLLQANLPVPDINPFPKINYNATFSAGNAPYCGANGKPILAMLGAGNTTVYSDLTAIITGPNRGPFAAGTFQELGDMYPERTKPYREFTIIFHDEINAVQAFPHFNDEVLAHTLHSARDAFAINYGTGGAGAEVLANRLKVGPMHQCEECLYEEFFLTSWAVGDPAMVVDKPANNNLVRQTSPGGPTIQCTTQDIKDGRNCYPAQAGPQATRVFYPDDPSNVYHSYLNDHVKFRNLHAGIEDHHIFHLHAHQWVHSPESDKSAYHDSQSIGQGVGWTYDIAYNGSGNRNRTVGDSIFHCHFYPHFAQGMWSLWRVHDVLETGTRLTSEGKPVHFTDGSGNVFVTNTRALPDGEIKTGTPIPAVVPIPGQPMAPLPAPVQLVNGDIGPAVPASNPGYPFFVAGSAGRRPPHPPLDTAWDGGLPRHVVKEGTVGLEEHNRLSFDKHLDQIKPRWVPETGTPTEILAMDFHSAGYHLTATPEGAMGQAFGVNHRPPVAGAPFADPCEKPNSFFDPTPQEPVNSNRTPDRTYKAANIQMDMVFNKEGWHYPQQRLLALWEDVIPTLYAERAPEPLFIRANDGECIEYHHTNLVPKTYEVDDYEVRTPTDVIGQHIHLVKFDVTSSDGSGNGFNYEDGAFSPEEVQSRIHAIRTANGCGPGDFDAYPYTQPTCPHPQEHPFFKPEGINANCDQDYPDDWLGAQINIQRWWADPARDQNGVSRTLRTVFTHDHFGPSTHQQVGLYAGLIIEPAGSRWYENEGVGQLGIGRDDGGPTSWSARIDPPTGDDFREFAVEFADFQHAYWPEGLFPPPGAGELQITCPNPQRLKGYRDHEASINPPAREEVPPPALYQKIDQCPLLECDPDGPYPDVLIVGDNLKASCPEAFSAADPGYGAVNYRTEPVALRVRDPNTNDQAGGIPGDLSYAYVTLNNRADTLLNGTSSPWVPYPPLTNGLYDGDPFTPLLRAYEADPIKVRVLVGAHEEEHNFNFSGVKWLQEPDHPSSGWRGSQMAGISEWFDFDVKRVPLLDGTTRKAADFLYRPSASNDFQWDGLWGLMRLYRGTNATSHLPVLGSNPDGAGPDAEEEADIISLRPVHAPELSEGALTGLSLSSDKTSPYTPDPPSQLPVFCPPHQAPVTFDIVALASQAALPQNTLFYNSRGTSVSYLAPSGGVCSEVSLPSPTPPPHAGPLHDPTAIFFAHKADVNTTTRRLKPGVNPEPLILRANAGDCIQVTLTNWLPTNYMDADGFSGVHMIVEDFNANDVDPSLAVGLHPALVTYDPLSGDGMNVGINPFVTGLAQTVTPNQSITYHWYAGHISKTSTGRLLLRPVEYGAIPLTSSDPIKHSMRGAVGALIIEPMDSTYILDQVKEHNIPSIPWLKTYASATIVTPEIKFREFVNVFQDDINLFYTDGLRIGLPPTSYPPVGNLSVVQDSTESGHRAFNYRTEPVWFRHGFQPETPPERTRQFTDMHQVFLDNYVSARPETPIWEAAPGDSIRFRVVHPAGNTQNQTFEVQGHVWYEEPFLTSAIPSQGIGYSTVSNWEGVHNGIGPGGHLQCLLPSAGGAYQIQGEYMYKSYVPWALDDGLWGLLQVDPTLPPTVGSSSIDTGK